MARSNLDSVHATSAVQTEVPVMNQAREARVPQRCPIHPAGSWLRA